MSTLARTLGFLWRWSLLVTGPIGLLFLVWSYRTAHRFEDFALRFRTLNQTVNLQRTGEYEAHALRRDLHLAATPAVRKRPSEIPVLELFVSASEQRRLEENLPHSGRSYVDASMTYPDGRIEKVSMRYKGDHFWHWAARKKSIRIKTRKKRLFQRMRGFSLNAPKMPDLIGEYLSYEFGDEFGLIRPQGEFVEVWVNGEFNGVHILIEQLEEMVTRKNGRMPGDLYAADVTMRESWDGIPSLVFENAGLWEKKAINNHFAPDETHNLDRLIELLNQAPSAERTAALRNLVDLEAFARFHAYRIICQTRHFDRTHNQRLYYDPWRNVFEPIIWDPVGWHQNWVPTRGQAAKMHILCNRLDHALYEDPVFLAARQRVLEEWIGGGGVERLLARARELAARIAPSVARDPALANLYTPLDPEDVFEAQARLIETMEQICRDIASELLAAPEVRYAVDPAAFPGSMRLEVGGTSFTSGLELSFQRPLESGQSVRLRYRTPEGARVLDVSGLLQLQGNVARIDFPFGPQFQLPAPEARFDTVLAPVVPAPATYDILIDGANLVDNALLDVTALGPLGTRVSARRSAGIMPPRPFTTAHDLAPPAPLRSPTLWTGNMTFEGVTRIAEDVIVDPGTVLAFGPDASVIVEGRVIARGTKDQPIRFVPASEGQTPWGTFTVRTPAADQSRFVWCEFTGGSGLKTPEAEFTAMFSVHDADGVLVEHCTFSDNHVVDDMVHAVYSDIVFLRSRFLRSRADALDVDISTAVVRECEFIDSGDDSVDFMTSTAAVIDTTMLRAGDKGVSVGEDTKVLILRCGMYEGEIGVEIKDRSEASIVHCDLHRNRLGLNAYKKNWRYDSGGWGYVYQSSIVDNGGAEWTDELDEDGVPKLRGQILADKHSRHILSDCYVSPAVEASKRIVIDGTTDDASPNTGKTPLPVRLRAERENSPEFLAPFWTEVVPRGRGLRRVE